MQNVHLEEVDGEETEDFQILNKTDILYFIIFFIITHNCACQQLIHSLLLSTNLGADLSVQI